MKKGNLFHVAIIPDGNRRWARKKGLLKTAGHEKSAEQRNVISLLNEAQNLGIKYFSIWGFSTENWKRDKHEIKKIFDILFKFLLKTRNNFHKNRIRFRHIGRKDRLPKKLLQEMSDLEEETKKYRDFNLQLFLDYGGRDEILRAVKKAIKNGDRNINEVNFSKFLDTKNIPDPDLIIRTSGEKRTSGFMPFQSVYSEIYFSKKFFPDFKKRDLRKAVLEFLKRERRFGK